MTGVRGQRMGHCLIVAAITMAAAWTLAQFTGAKRIAYRGQHLYLIGLQYQSLDVTVARVTLETTHQQGCFGLILSRTPVPFDGMQYWGETTRDPWPRLTHVRAYVDDPARPLPPSVIQRDGSNIYSSYAVSGYRLGIPYWPFVLGGAVVTIGRAIGWIKRAIVERRRAALARFGYCGGCGYDLRATPHRCPECGAVPA